jgi:hypothetical protein
MSVAPRSAWLLSLAVAGLGGCARVHVPPPAGAPQALAKLRIVHHTATPGDLSDHVWLNDAEIRLLEHDAVGAVSTARPIAPGQAHWRVRAVFSHVDPTRRDDTSNLLIGPCGTDSSGRPLFCNGPGPSPMHPPTDPEVIDAVCEANLKHRAEAGRIYLVRFDFYASDYCTARCLVQSFEPSGRFRLEPCPRPAAAP